MTDQTRPDPAPRDPVLPPASSSAADTAPEWEETRPYNPAVQARPEWPRSTSPDEATRDSGSWANGAWVAGPARPDPVAVAPVRRTSPFGQVLLAAILGAVLASGGTFLALDA